MATETGTWGVLPKSLRSAFIIALATSFLAAGLLFQSNVRTTAPNFSRGGSFSGRNSTPLNNDLSVPTPTIQPLPTGESKSSAILTAPSSRPGSAGLEGPPFPTLGRYVYGVQGTESASFFGSRTYPNEMTMTVHRPVDAQPALKADEIEFDLDFSTDHEEREIVAYRKDGLKFSYEAGSITFGPRTQTSEAAYTPAMLQVPIPLKQGAEISGKSEAVAPDGTTSRVEDWTVTVDGTESLSIMGDVVDAWVVEIQRKSESGSAENVDRTRKYWFDADRGIWVQWTEHFTGSQEFGPGTFTYMTDFTATLERIEPL